MSRAGITTDEHGNIIHERSGEILQIRVDKPFGHSYYIDPPISRPMPHGCTHKDNGGYNVKLCMCHLCPLYPWNKQWWDNAFTCKYAVYGHYNKDEFIVEPNPYLKKRRKIK